MSRVLTLNNYSFRSSYPSRLAVKGRLNSSKILSMGDKKVPKIKCDAVKGSSKIAFLALIFVLVVLILFSGAFYLYQVNDLATKGYEIKDIENRIQNLEKDSKRMQIKEVELRSMYNIEKSTQDLNLVNPASVSYIEMDSSIAMK